MNDDLLVFAEKQGITVDICHIPKNKSLSIQLAGKSYIALDKEAMQNSADERTHLIHELGHCETGAFYRLGASQILREKAEAQAERWAVKMLIPKAQLDELFRKGYQKWDIADFYNVNEQMVDKACYLYYEVGMAG